MSQNYENNKDNDVIEIIQISDSDTDEQKLKSTSKNINIPEPPKILRDLYHMIKQRGHTCADLYYKSKSDKFKLHWCQQEECKRKVHCSQKKRKFEVQENDLWQALENEGHDCVYYLERKAMGLVWCNEKVCTHK